MPSQLRLEFSETAISGASDSVSGTLAELRSYGIHTTIGDFGTNSSNLQHLSRLPIDGVRIDGSLLAGIEGGDGVAGDRAIFESIVRLSKILNLEVITDSIETETQLAYAFESGSDVALGPLFAEPMSEDHFLAWLPRATPERARPFPSSRDAERKTIELIRAELQQEKTRSASSG